MYVYSYLLCIKQASIEWFTKKKKKEQQQQQQQLGTRVEFGYVPGAAVAIDFSCPSSALPTYLLTCLQDLSYIQLQSSCIEVKYLEYSLSLLYVHIYKLLVISHTSRCCFFASGYHLNI